MLAGLGYPGMLRPWMMATARWTAVTLLDLPGWQSQETITCPPTIEGIAAAATQWLRQVDSPPVVLIGRSTGAQAALRAAVDLPERLLGVVLTGPTLDPAARTWPRLLTRYAGPLWREHPAEIPAVAGSIAASGMRPLITLIQSARADRPEQRITELRVPTMIITGRHDRVASPQWSRRLAESASAPCRILPGGHNSCFSHAAMADQFVRDAVAGW